MKVTKFGSDGYLVEWKYKDFLKIGCEFKGATIIKLEEYEYATAKYVKVTVQDPKYSI